jgi:hypothetical protein
MFHSRLGKKIKKAARPPSQIQGLRKTRRCSVEQKTDDDAEAEDGDGILFLHAYTGDHAEPDPVARIVALDSEDDEVGAAHPEIRFEAVGAEQASVR